MRLLPHRRLSLRLPEGPAKAGHYFLRRARSVDEDRSCAFGDRRRPAACRPARVASRSLVVCDRLPAVGAQLVAWPGWSLVIARGWIQDGPVADGSSGD